MTPSSSEPRRHPSHHSSRGTSKLHHNPAAALYTAESYFREALYVSHRRTDPSTDFEGVDATTLDKVSREITREGRGEWCRLEETLELAHRIGARRLGIVFCSGFVGEARILKRVLEAHGLEVHSSCCKTGSVPKETLGILDSEKVKPGTAEVLCNPLAQAELSEPGAGSFGIATRTVCGTRLGHDGSSRSAGGLYRRERPGARPQHGGGALPLVRIADRAISSWVSEPWPFFLLILVLHQRAPRYRYAWSSYSPPGPRCLSHYSDSRDGL